MVRAVRTGDDDPSGKRLKTDKKSESDHGMESGSDGYISDIGDPSMTAYQALLGSLCTKGGFFSEAFAQRRKEEQGMSSSEDVESSESGKGSEDGGNMNADGNPSDGNTEVDEGMNDDANPNDHGNGVGLALVSYKASNIRMEVIEKVVGVDEGEGVPKTKEAVESEEESEDDTTSISKRAFSNSYKKHLEYQLGDKEVALLSKGGVKFRCKTAAAGVQKANWATSVSDLPVEERDLEACGIKTRLRRSWLSCHKDLSYGDFQTSCQCQFFNYCNSYRDILFSKRPRFYAHENMKDLAITDAYLLHILNHVFKTRDLVTKNNEKKDIGMKIPEAPRDQGFTRPTVLILLPLRSCALRLVRRLLDLVPSTQKGTVEHKVRFFDEFGAEVGSANENDSAAGGLRASKPADYNELFGGNNDDHFRIGMKFTRKSIKLYSDFYSSDVIVASPLGLITKIGEAEQERDKDVDFLSSIEILVIDYADVILMQNWSHVIEIGDQLNHIPVQQHGTDFMRIRELFLNGYGRYFRQTIILSAYADAGINAFFHRSCLNYAGKLKFCSEQDGILSKVILQVRQVYERVNCASLTEVDEARFALFKKQVFGTLKETLQGGIMIFVSSYFDFVRLRNFLKAENMSFCLLGEYTKQSDISRSRAWFFHGKRRIMLYTERAHFYHRYKIRGVKELIFYSLPENAEFYSEITNMMEGLENSSSLILFSQFDNFKLERVVGSSRANRMLKSENRTFMFC